MEPTEVENQIEYISRCAVTVDDEGRKFLNVEVGSSDNTQKVHILLEDVIAAIQIDVAKGTFELDEETRFILGIPCFKLGPYAERLREKGHHIARKAEDEQAAVIHWMLRLYWKHGGENWGKEANKLLAR